MIISVIVFPNEEDDLTLNPARRRQLKSLPTKHEIISALAVGGRWVTRQSNLQVSLYIYKLSMRLSQPNGA